MLRWALPVVCLLVLYASVTLAASTTAARGGEELTAAYKCPKCKERYMTMGKLKKHCGWDKEHDPEKKDECTHKRPFLEMGKLRVDKCGEIDTDGCPSATDRQVQEALAKAQEEILRDDNTDKLDAPLTPVQKAQQIALAEAQKKSKAKEDADAHEGKAFYS